MGTASLRPTTLVTPATSTPSPCPPTARSVPVVARTPRPCCGTLMTGSTCTLDHADTINSLTFSPNRYWLWAATGPTIKIWDLESKNMVEELKPEVPGSARADPPQCLSLAWSADGQTLFAGYSDNLIRVWQVSIAGTR